MSWVRATKIQPVCCILMFVLLHLTCCHPCTALYCLPEQYEQNLAGPALDYVGGDAARLSDPLVSPLLAEYGKGKAFPPTLIQVCAPIRV